MTILGLTGKIGSGKDSVGKILTETYKYKRVAFADVLKNLAYDLNPIVAVLVTDDGTVLERLQDLVLRDGWEDVKRKSPEIRRTLQALGVAARDNLEYDVWVNAVKNKLNGDDPTVVTDVRFPNEAALIAHLGGTVYRVVRPGYDGDQHATETALDKYEFPTIDNSGTLEDLNGIVADIVADQV